MRRCARRTAGPSDPRTTTIMRLEPLETACEWTSDTIRDSYVYEFNDTQLAEIDSALAYAEAHTDDVLDITTDEFPLPTLAPALADITRDLIDGRGVVLFRGVPVAKYGKE